MRGHWLLSDRKHPSVGRHAGWALTAADRAGRLECQWATGLGRASKQMAGVTGATISGEKVSWRRPPA